MVVVVEILTGPLFHVRLPDDDGATVSDLKKEICVQQKLSQDRLILILDGGGHVTTTNYLMCENEVPLKDYGVRDGSHVYIFFTMPESADENQEDHGTLNSVTPLNTPS